MKATFKDYVKFFVLGTLSVLFLSLFIGAMCRLAYEFFNLGWSLWPK